MLGRYNDDESIVYDRVELIMFRDNKMYIIKIEI